MQRLALRSDDARARCNGTRSLGDGVFDGREAPVENPSNLIPLPTAVGEGPGPAPSVHSTGLGPQGEGVYHRAAIRPAKVGAYGGRGLPRKHWYLKGIAL